MLQSRIVLKTTCALAPLILAACALPELVPAGTQNLLSPTGLCNIEKDGPDKGKLIITVINDGTMPAPATTTLVEFRGVTTPVVAKLPTHQVAAYPGKTKLYVPIPDACYEPTTRNCYFRITADADNAVREVSEASNASWGVCSR